LTIRKALSLSSCWATGEVELSSADPEDSSTVEEESPPPPNKLATRSDESLPPESDESALAESSLELSPSAAVEAEGVTRFFSPFNISVQRSVSSEASMLLVDRVFASLSPEDPPELEVVPEVPELDFNTLLPFLLEIT
jgi:hypothetical protein